jgi:hypothetical protein
MPRLVEKANGTHFIRHFYHGNATWQIDGDGVLFLGSFGVRPGELFSTDLFMVAWSLDYLYTNHRARASARAKPYVGDVLLADSATRIYRAMYARDFKAVSESSWLLASGQLTPAALRRSLNSKRLGVVASWKLRQVYASSREVSNNNEPTHLGMIYADWRIDLAGESQVRSNHLDLWFKWSGQWFWIDCGWTNQLIRAQES